MKAKRILHVSVNVAGCSEESQRFYGTFLGLADAERPEIPGVPGSWFKAGEAQVHLVGLSPMGSPIDPSGPHFCVAVEDIAEARAELDAGSVPYVEAKQGDVVQIWITDPAGNVVELQEDREL